MKQPRFICLAVPALLVPLILAQSARAANANGTWTQLTSGALWSDTGNWSGGTVADGSGFTADFNTLNITVDNTVHLDSARTIGNLTFGDTTTSSSANWILDNNGSGSNVLTLAGITPTITVNALGSGKNASISAVIAGSAGLTKAGTGTLAITGDSTYTGSTIINAGLLQIGNGGTTGSIDSSSPVVININSGGLGLGFKRTDTFTFANAISGAGRVNQNGTGTVILTNAANSYTGVTTLAAGSTIRGSDATVVGGSTATSTVLGNNSTISLGNNSAIELRANGLNDSSAQTISFKNSILAFATGVTFTVNVDRESATGGTGKSLGFTGGVTLANDAVMNVTGANGFNLVVGTVTVGTGATDGNVTLNPTSANLVVTSIVNSGGSSHSHTVLLDGTAAGNAVTGAMTNGAGGTLSVTKQNTGTWTLFGVSTYTGATSINAGTLALSGSGAINANSAITVAAGATFDTSALSAYTFSTATTTTIGVNATSSGQIKAAAATFSNASLTFDFGDATTLLALYDVLAISGSETGHFLAGGVTATGSSIAGTFVGDGSGNWNLTSGGYNLSFSESSGILTATAIPEPSTWALLVGGAALAGTLIVRRSRRSAWSAL